MVHCYVTVLTPTKDALKITYTSSHFSPAGKNNKATAMVDYMWRNLPFQAVKGTSANTFQGAVNNPGGFFSLHKAEVGFLLVSFLI